MTKKMPWRVRVEIRLRLKLDRVLERIEFFCHTKPAMAGSLFIFGVVGLGIAATSWVAITFFK